MYFGGPEWMITFDTELGDLPLLDVTTGRLTGGRVAAAVKEHQAGSSATLIYDGTLTPAVKTFTASGLEEDSLYAFKVRLLEPNGILSQTKRYILGCTRLCRLYPGFGRDPG